jgi:2',3'-cyclic-nucleotide 2'-phosphodiesterase (5'-nucleotidase family)
MKMRLPILLLLCFLITFIPSCGETHIQIVNLTILHTNDIRSHLDNAPQRAAVINNIREETKTNGENFLLLDSGNIISGTPYYTLYQGQADVWFMNYMRYNAAAVGNHEFDGGTTVFADFIKNARFPMLSANIDVSKEKGLKGKIAPWLIIQVGGERYGIMGLTNPNTPEISNPGDKIIFSDYGAAAKKAVGELEGRGINKIIALTNIGWSNDLALASKVSGIDIIIGAESGTVPAGYPVTVYAGDAPTVVVQAGADGNYIGRLNVTFDADGVVQLRDESRLINIDSTITPDSEAEEKLQEYRESIIELENNIIGSTTVDLNGATDMVRSRETNLADLIAEAMLEKAAKSGAEIAIWNCGAIRSSIAKGDISLGQAMEVLPYDNQLVTADLTGDQIIAALENGVSQVESTAGRFPAVAGLRFTWNPSLPAGGRIVSVEVKTANGYQLIKGSQAYRVVTNDFMAGGGDGYAQFLNASKTMILGYSDYETLAAYISAHSPLTPLTDSRINLAQ